MWFFRCSVRLFRVTLCTPLSLNFGFALPVYRFITKVRWKKKKNNKNYKNKMRYGLNSRGRAWDWELDSVVSTLAIDLCGITYYYSLLRYYYFNHRRVITWKYLHVEQLVLFYRHRDNNIVHVDTWTNGNDVGLLPPGIRRMYIILLL